MHRQAKVLGLFDDESFLGSEDHDTLAEEVLFDVLSLQLEHHVLSVSSVSRRLVPEELRHSVASRVGHERIKFEPDHELFDVLITQVLTHDVEQRHSFATTRLGGIKLTVLSRRDFVQVNNSSVVLLLYQNVEWSVSSLVEVVHYRFIRTCFHQVL